MFGKKSKNTDVKEQLMERIAPIQDDIWGEFFDKFPGIFFVYDSKLNTIFWSREVARVTGYTVEEAHDKPPLEFLDPKQKMQALRAIKNVVTNGGAQLEIDVITKEGGRIPFMFRAFRFKVHKKTYFAGIGFNISRQKELAEKIAESESRYETVVKQTQQLIYEYDVKSGEISWSGAIEELTGYADEEFQAFTIDMWEQHIHPDDHDRVISSLSDAEKNITSFDTEYRFKIKDGSYIYIEDTGVFVGNGNKAETMYGAMRDISDRKKQEQEIKELNELRNKFIGIVSHQLRTPLNAIKWNLESLMSGDLGPLTDAQEEFLRLTYKAEDNVITRLSDLLTVLDIEEGRVVTYKEPTSVDALVTSVIGVYREKAKLKEIDLNYAAPKLSLPSVECDPQKIRSVIEELVSNAIDYSHENTTVTAELSQADGAIRFEVKDQGVGIPQNEQNRIFKRFYRASNASSMITDSSGVGLAIAQYFIEQHNGTIGFVSTEGEGSTFWFEIPI